MVVVVGVVVMTVLLSMILRGISLISRSRLPAPAGVITRSCDHTPSEDEMASLGLGRFLCHGPQAPVPGSLKDCAYAGARAWTPARDGLG